MSIIKKLHLESLDSSTLTQRSKELDDDGIVGYNTWSAFANGCESYFYSCKTAGGIKDAPETGNASGVIQAAWVVVTQGKVTSCFNKVDYEYITLSEFDYFQRQEMYKLIFVIYRGKNNLF